MLLSVLVLKSASKLFVRLLGEVTDGGLVACCSSKSLNKRKKASAKAAPKSAWLHFSIAATVAGTIINEMNPSEGKKRHTLATVFVFAGEIDVRKRAFHCFALWTEGNINFKQSTVE